MRERSLLPVLALGVLTVLAALALAGRLDGLSRKVSGLLRLQGHAPAPLQPSPRVSAR
jgi:hypothetical protein